MSKIKKKKDKKEKEWVMKELGQTLGRRGEQGGR